MSRLSKCSREWCNRLMIITDWIFKTFYGLAPIIVVPVIGHSNFRNDDLYREKYADRNHVNLYISCPIKGAKCVSQKIISDKFYRCLFSLDANVIKSERLVFIYFFGTKKKSFWLRLAVFAADQLRDQFLCNKKVDFYCFYFYVMMH